MSQPDELNRLGRNYLASGDESLAIALQCLVLRLAPNHQSARRDLATARRTIVSAAEAERLYACALALEPDIACHHRCYGSTQPFVGMNEVERMLQAALRADPSHARAHAALANISARRGDQNTALYLYGLATMLDWEFPEAHLALAELYEATDKTPIAALHRREALARNVLYRARAPYATRRVLLLKAPSGFPANASLEYCIDHHRTDLDVLFLTPRTRALPDLTDVDVIFNAIGETEENAPTIAHCIDLLGSTGVPVINHPASLRNVRRSALATTLRDVRGCSVLSTLRAAHAAVREAAGAIGYPLVIRPVDTHRGDGLELIRPAAEIAAYLERHPAAHYNIAPFADYRSADGYYRKYRVIVVDGVPFAYHLAISEHWLVHYWRAKQLMLDNAWMRAEEERFLRRPELVFPNWSSVFRDVADAVGLDYFGVDCAATAGGDVLVFECDPSSFVHCREARDGAFAYKYDYVPRIFSAIDALLEDRAARGRAAARSGVQPRAKALR